jgi:hypothetical protein
MSATVTFARNTISGLNRRLCNSIVSGDSWLTTPYANEAAQRYVVWTIDEHGNVSVKKFNHGNVNKPADAILVEKLTQEELAELLAADALTQKQFAALCFSVVSNKGPIETFLELKAKQRLAKKPFKRAFIAHMVWLVNNSWNVDGILADEVFKLMSHRLAWSVEEQVEFIKKLSLFEFYNPKNRDARAYRDAYERFFADRFMSLPQTAVPHIDLALVRENMLLDLARYQSITAMMA